MFAPRCVTWVLCAAVIGCLAHCAEHHSASLIRWHAGVVAAAGLADGKGVGRRQKRRRRRIGLSL
ncbi:MAG TPA: hypothetical protein VGE52_21090 [Pirellulales bacterium]